MKKSEFNVSGLNCMHCVAKVVYTLEGVEGVKVVNISTETNTVMIESEKTLSLDDLNLRLEDAGDYRLS